MVGENLFRVKQTDGGLKGRIHVAGAEGDELGDAGLLNIFLVHRGEVIDRVVSRRNGTFTFDDVAPGENDKIFPAAGAHPYQRDLKNVELHLLNTGHFALEEDGDVIANHIRQFLGKNVGSERRSVAVR